MLIAINLKFEIFNKSIILGIYPNDSIYSLKINKNLRKYLMLVSKHKFFKTPRDNYNNTLLLQVKNLPNLNIISSSS